MIVLNYNLGDIGDVRLQLFIRALPPLLTIVGKQKGKEILPIKLSKDSEPEVIAVDADADSDTMITIISDECEKEIFMDRIIGIVIISIGFMFFGKLPIFKVL